MVDIVEYFKDLRTVYSAGDSLWLDVDALPPVPTSNFAGFGKGVQADDEEKPYEESPEEQPQPHPTTDDGPDDEYGECEYGPTGGFGGSVSLSSFFWMGGGWLAQ